MQAERSFTLADLTAFAELSGDFNPLHTDPLAARRTLFGDCVAHGVFVLLWALDSLQAQSGSQKRWVKISAKFLRPAVVGSKVTATAKKKNTGEISLTVSEAGRVLLEADVTWAEAPGGTNVSRARNELPPREIPALAPTLTETNHGEALALFWSIAHGKRFFPALAATQLPDSLAALLAATRVIGMKVPGEHSLFLQLEISFVPHPAEDQPFTYRVAAYRGASQRLAVAVAGTAGSGVLKALVRPAPVAQPDMACVRQKIPADRFRGRRVIVIGGSRGLGEVAAKVLAAGGAEVALSYRLGSHDASRVVADIAARGAQAFAFRLDTNSQEWETSLAANCARFDHLCYFPTPPIVGGDGASFNAPLFDNFCAVYVTGLINLAQWLAKQSAGRFALFNASSVYVQTPPLRNLEYAAAKAASEVCCRWLAAAHPNARIYVARLPPLITDQTASILSASEQDTVETMLAELSAWLPA